MSPDESPVLPDQATRREFDVHRRLQAVNEALRAENEALRAENEALTRESQRTLNRLAETTASLKVALHDRRTLSWVQADVLRDSWAYLAARGRIAKDGPAVEDAPADPVVAALREKARSVAERNQRIIEAELGGRCGSLPPVHGKEGQR